MREPYLDRYLALLKDADDEPKRWALIQLLIAEGARDKTRCKIYAGRNKSPVTATVALSIASDTRIATTASRTTGEFA